MSEHELILMLCIHVINIIIDFVFLVPCTVTEKHKWVEPRDYYLVLEKRAISNTFWTIVS